MMKGQKGYVLVLKGSAPESAKHWWTTFAQAVAGWRRVYLQRRQLAQLSDESLKDIGLSRADVQQEIERPFWDDPMKKH